MPKKRKLLWQIFLPFFTIVVLSLSAVGWYASNTLTRFHDKKTKAELRERALIARELLTPLLKAEQYTEMQRLSRHLGHSTSTRITVILPSGRVVADSEKNPAQMDNHGNRPEVLRVLKGAVGMARRHSDTLNKQMIYLAVPLENDGKLRAVVRTSIPQTAVTRDISNIYTDIIWGGAIVALLAALISLWVSHRINRPIQEMQRGAEQFAEGNLDYRLQTATSVEMAALADTMNRMAAQLGERISQITNQRNELGAVLKSMVEAVFAVNMDEQLIRFNRAAEELLDLDGHHDMGRTIAEVCPNPELKQFVTRALTASKAISGEIVFKNGASRYLQAQGAKLRDERGVSMGALIVLHDVTQLKRLEEIRRDFVANVSHELKTPIASVKAGAETLRDGALDDPHGARQFIDIIVRHADRLAAIIDDLLTLSRIEQEKDPESFNLTATKLKEVLESAVLAVREQAEDKQIRIETTCAENLAARINPNVLVHAIINLLDNAIKYSDEKSCVSLAAEASADRIHISVSDTGCGIPEEDQQRIFERFYRVDKARSRKLGGTGLGLAIVKHIASAHNGHVSVQSTFGEGSRFTIHIPAT
jgi:two-component system phosphate regulon sensor histidine kinase PhoR